ncbi:MAG: cytochrome c3 family protein [Chloroflexota bacterium]
MHSNRLGCLTTTGIIAVLITTFALVGVAFASGSQMFTAGSLSTVNESGNSYGGVMSHAEINDCKSCHTALWESETMADRCAKCHTDIAKEMFDVAKLHGAIVNKNSSLACRDCHPDHRGPTASLTELGDNTFPHDPLGYSLNGHPLTSAREPFACTDCHSEDLSTFASSTCNNCHRQIDVVFTQAHVLSFGTDCLACHDGVDRFGDDFTHTAFSFKLVGKHAEAPCTDCHLDAHNLAALQSAPQDCFSCHAVHDVHQARFGQDCGSCHSPEGWKPAKFDHNLSVFKLEGEHNEVACERCHQNGVYLGTPQDCYSCHSDDDEHNGQFGTDCGACHTPRDWDDATFDHARSVFPLDGAHRSVECTRCHVNSVFKGTPADCYSCHREDDAHGDQFGTNCAACHNTSSWEDARFDHSVSGFPLTGAHANILCESCHTNGQFSGLSSSCVSCHADPAFHAGMFGSNCADCHNTSNWSATYNGSHPGIADEGGYGVNHGHTSCRTCHTSNLSTATCTACHDGNEGEGGDDD